jgi:hypothetical protein
VIILLVRSINNYPGLIVLFSAIAYFLGYCKIAMEYYNSNVIMQV